MRMSLLPALAATALLFTQCGEQDVQPTATHNEAQALFQTGTASPEADQSKVFTALEILHSERYSYLRGEHYWVATVRGEFEVGQTYEFVDGIYKRNYHSEAFNRDFETIYLVSRLSGHRNAAPPKAVSQTSSTPATATVARREGSVALGDIIADPSQYVEQSVQITGRVTKVNAHIMKRHWVHLSDGTEGGHDFVLTTTDEVPVGHVATFIGTIRTGVNFGSGYQFDLIMEEAQVVQD